MNRAKELLKKVKHYDKWIDRNTKERQRLKEMAVNTTANFGREPVQGTKNGDKIGNAVAEIIDLENKIAADIVATVKLREKIWRTLQKMKNPNYIELLDKRYFEHEAWYEIADEMHCGYRGTLKRHKNALQAFEEALNSSHKMKITLLIDSDNAIGVKETLAEYLEQFGDVTVASIEEIKVETKHENKTL